MTGTHEGGVKSSQGGRGDPHKASPSAITNHLAGIKFPATKDDLIELAESNDAPDDVMYVLRQFNDTTYNAITDVSKEIGRVE